ncbi:MAG: cytochrome c3 family protein [Geothermobacteraceae bacterium]
MKKVLVIAAALALLAAPAFGFIANSKHDLSSGSTSGGATSNTDEICVFCHTPHGATTDGPLWNKVDSGSTASAIYADPSNTMDATPTLANINASDAVLCLDCHDGANLANLTNPPNSLSGALTITDGGNVTGGVITGAALVDGDFSNDHPVGFEWADGNDSEIELIATIQAALPGAMSFGSTGNQMWCSSCHDVHGVEDGTNPGNVIPAFLRVKNTGSALCLTCHIK